MSLTSAKDNHQNRVFEFNINKRQTSEHGFEFSHQQKTNKTIYKIRYLRQKRPKGYLGSTQVLSSYTWMKHFLESFEFFLIDSDESQDFHHSKP